MPAGSRSGLRRISETASPTLRVIPSPELGRFGRFGRFCRFSRFGRADAAALRGRQLRARPHALQAGGGAPCAWCGRARSTAAFAAWQRRTTSTSTLPVQPKVNSPDIAMIGASMCQPTGSTKLP